MIVVDSSVWINQMRGLATPATAMLDEIEEAYDTILLGDLVLLEVLRGARDDAHARHLERWLRKFVIERMLDDILATKAAANYRLLRGRGITVRKTVDLIIATFCVERGHSLLHDDRDFDAMVPHLGLRVM